MKVLLYSKDEIVIELLPKLLHKFEYKFEVVKTEDAALARLKEEDYRLLVIGQSYPLDDQAAMAKFLQNCRADLSDYNEPLVAVVHMAKYGLRQIIRAPVAPDQPHAYIGLFDVVSEVSRQFEQLLGGLSTQNMPGDEGYSLYEHSFWKIAFEYPSLWLFRGGVRRDEDVRIFGPTHSNQKTGSQIIIYRHLTHDPHSPHLMQEVIDNYFRHYAKLDQITSNEYLWEISYLEGGMPSGKMILELVVRDNEVFALALKAAEDDFDDYRPVYSHLLETFEFLS